MIECGKLRAKIPESTCITRQAKIAKKNGNSGPHWGNNGSEWLNLSQCEGCNIGLELYHGSKNTTVQKKEKRTMAKEKTCTKCGKSKDINFFYRQSSSKDGHHPWCKKCHNLSMAMKNSEKNTPTVIKEPEKAVIPFQVDGRQIATAIVDQSTHNVETPVEKPTGKKIVLDFTDQPELFEKVEQWAGDNMRTVHQQIIFHLKFDALGKRKAG